MDKQQIMKYIRRGMHLGELTGEGDSYRPLTSFIDVILIVLFLFMFGVVINKQQSIKEYQTRIDMLQKGLSKNTSPAKPDPETPSITLLFKSGKVGFSISSKAGSRTLNSAKEIRAYLEQTRPAKVVIRAEQSVPAGTLQEVLLDCQELGVLPFLAALQKG